MKWKNKVIIIKKMLCEVNFIVGQFIGFIIVLEDTYE